MGGRPPWRGAPGGSEKSLPSPWLGSVRGDQRHGWLCSPLPRRHTPLSDTQEKIAGAHKGFDGNWDRRADAARGAPRWARDTGLGSSVPEAQAAASLKTEMALAPEGWSRFPFECRQGVGGPRAVKGPTARPQCRGLFRPPGWSDTKGYSNEKTFRSAAVFWK